MELFACLFSYSPMCSWLREMPGITSELPLYPAFPGLRRGRRLWK